MSTYWASGTAVPGLLWLGPPAASTAFGTAMTYVGYGRWGRSHCSLLDLPSSRSASSKATAVVGAARQTCSLMTARPHLHSHQRRSHRSPRGRRGCHSVGRGTSPPADRTRRPEAPPGGSNRSLFRRAEPTLGDEHPTERTSTMIRTLISESSGPDGPPPTIVLDQS